MNNLELITNVCLQRIAGLEASLATHPRLAHGAALLHQGLSLVPVELIYLVVAILYATVLIGLIVAPIAGFSTYVERRVAARMQARIGCNRVGPEGLLQFLADGIKLILKEDNIPKGADRILFRMAPYLVIGGAFMSFVCIPFGKHLVASDLNIGVFYLIGVSSLVVVGILLAGWASNNKWSLLGSMRSAAQIVSYEIPLALALMVPVLCVGSLSLQELNRAQAGGFHHWILFAAFPSAFIAFFVYFIAALAELNRTPFDLPEAESELVSGYATEYSGMRWGLFFVGEYANMFLVGAICATAFLGGWQASWANSFFAFGALFFTLIFAVKSLSYLAKLLPRLLLKGERLFDLLSTVRPLKLRKSAFVGLALVSLMGSLALQLLSDIWLIQLLILMAKAYFIVFVMIWIRWTLPRYRIDQMMSLCWKKLVPIGFVCVLWASIFIMVFHG